LKITPTKDGGDLTHKYILHIPRARKIKTHDFQKHYSCLLYLRLLLQKHFLQIRSTVCSSISPFFRFLAVFRKIPKNAQRVSHFFFCQIATGTRFLALSFFLSVRFSKPFFVNNGYSETVLLLPSWRSPLLIVEPLLCESNGCSGHFLYLPVQLWNARERSMVL